MKFLGWVALCALLIYGAHAHGDDAVPVPKAALSTWVHVFGCPPHRRRTQHIVLVFADGSTMVLNLTDISEEKRKLLQDFIGSIEGYNVAYNCGTQI